MPYSTVRVVRYVMTIGSRLYKPTQCRATKRGNCPEHCRAKRKRCRSSEALKMTSINCTSVQYINVGKVIYQAFRERYSKTCAIFRPAGRRRSTRRDAWIPLHTTK